MKTSSISQHTIRRIAFLTINIAALAIFAASAQCAYSPVHEALARLEHAHSKYEERASGAKKRTSSDILKSVIDAETHLMNARNNKGSTLSVALKEISIAKEELEAAKSGEGDEHFKNADDQVQLAMKHLNQALRMRQPK